MIKNRLSQKHKYHAFTLIEMVIVLVIVGIMLSITMYLSAEQIQKVKDKTVKESIIAEMQSRYSRNLGSSSFAGKMYNTMDVNFTEGKGKIDFTYDVIKKETSDKDIENTFSDFFEIRYLTFNPDDANPGRENSVNIKYSPYKISCEIGEGKDNVIIVTRVNDNKDYCFEINKQNCRMIEVSESRCDDLENKTNLKKKQ